MLKNKYFYNHLLLKFPLFQINKTEEVKQCYSYLLFFIKKSKRLSLVTKEISHVKFAKVQ